MSEAALASPSYDKDIYAWALGQADLVRAMNKERVNSPLDLDNLLEEIEGVARNYRGAVLSQTRRIIEHFLKLEYSRAAYHRRAGQRSIIDARAQLQGDLTATLRHELARELDKQYALARKLAVLALEAYEEHAEAELFPLTCPYSLEQIESEDWYPEPRFAAATN